MPEVDNKKQNNQNSPFGTFDWSKTYGEAANKPKDISSDMWTPISTGIPVQGTQSSLLRDEQNESGPAQRSTSAKHNNPAKRPEQKKKQKKGKNYSKTREEKKPVRKPVVSGTRDHPVSKEPINSKPVKKKKVSKEEIERRQQKFIAEREKRAIINDHRRYEKSKEDYRTKISNGHSSNDVRRRKAKKKKRNKKLIAGILVFAIILIAGICAGVYFYMYGAPVQKVLVEGKSSYSNAEIINASGIQTGTGMLQIREKAVNNAVTNKLPYIKNVKVDYQFPDTVSLEITQTTEKFLISGKKGYICVDADGKIVSLKKKKLKDGQFKLNGFESQTAIEGEDYIPENGNKEKFEIAKQIAALLEENKIEKTNVIYLEDLNNIIVEYNSRINIYVGGADRLSEKLGLASKVILQEVGENSTGYIEARYENRVFYKEGSKTIS